MEEKQGWFTERSRASLEEVEGLRTGEGSSCPFPRSSVDPVDPRRGLSPWFVETDQPGLKFVWER